MRGRAPPHAVKRRPSGITPAYAGKSTRSTIRLLFAMGSPPRMRGRGFEYVKQYGEAGITPAYAGKRHPYCGPVGYRQDHPRVCGEEERTNRCACWTEGSPPRMRGRGARSRRRKIISRITPAYAGKRRPEDGRKNKCGDHPRVCGEELATGAAKIGGWGSPPRMRGRVIRGLATRITSGITPAYAGKSAGNHVRKGLQRDHPRVCGEELFFLLCGGDT